MKKINILEQFKGLDRKAGPAYWPIVPKVTMWIAIFVSTIAAGYLLDTQSQIEELETKKTKELKLKDEYKLKYSQAVNLDLYKAQLEEVDTLFGTLLKQLPDKSRMESLITEINQAGTGRGLSFDLFKPANDELQKEFYAEIPISIKVKGMYHNMGLFSSDVANFSRIVTLNNIEIKVNNNGMLEMDAVAKTFRYLDDKEIKSKKTSDKKKAKPDEK